MSEQTKCMAADGKTAVWDFCHGTPLMVRASDFNALYHEAERLRKDAERYRWLKHNPQWLGWDSDFRPNEVEREIDAAMAEKPSIGAA